MIQYNTNINNISPKEIGKRQKESKKEKKEKKRKEGK